MHGRKAAVGDMICVIVGILCLFAILIIGVDIFGQINTAVKKTRIERTYIAAMETEGYLSPEKQEELIDDLMELGVYNISLAGTTTTEAGYGNIIILSVTGMINTNGITGITDSWHFLRGGSYEFKIYQKSTAKY